jgi:hypothetical protein
MNAPMFGITMPVRYEPKRWTLAPAPVTPACRAMATMSSSTISHRM